MWLGQRKRNRRLTNSQSGPQCLPPSTGMFISCPDGELSLHFLQICNSSNTSDTAILRLLISFFSWWCKSCTSWSWIFSFWSFLGILTHLRLPIIFFPTGMLHPVTSTEFLLYIYIFICFWVYFMVYFPTFTQLFPKEYIINRNSS